MKTIFVSSLIMLLVFVSGCITQQAEENAETEMNDVTEETENSTVIFDIDIATIECKNLCKDFLSEGVDLTSGPCLSDNNIDWDVTDWVCDVAHLPRQGIDELSANQCLDFRVSRAHHFVEVDENCNLIRAY